MHSANDRLDQQLRWRCVSTRKRPQGRVWAKNARHSAIGTRKTRGVVRPLLVPVLSLAKGPQRRRLVLLDDGLRGHESYVTTAGHPTDDRGRNRSRIHAPWLELSPSRRKSFSFFSHPGPIGQGLYFTPVVKASFLGEHSKSNSKWLRHHF